MPGNMYLFKINNRNPKKRCEICSKFHPNALTPSIHLKFIHTETNLQLSAKILFKHV